MLIFTMEELWMSINDFCKDARLNQILLNAASPFQLGKRFIGRFYKVADKHKIF